MTTSSAPLIDIDQVRYAPGGVQVLRGVTLQSDAARIGIVGRNGSGKTSFARVLSGLVAADAGQVRIAGVEVARDRRAALGAVGILFQNPDHQIIFPTVEEEIAFGLHQMGQSRAEAARGVSAILSRFDKAHWATAAIHQLSQGQRQLVCLMAVLAMQPRVIVLDEPFAGVDPISVSDIKHIVRHLRDKGIGVLITDHNVRETLDICENAYIVSGGHIIASGNAEDILANQQVKEVYLGDEFRL